MAHTEWQVHEGDDYIQILPADGHTEEPLADIFGGIEVARLMAAAPKLAHAAGMALRQQYGEETEGWDVAQGLMDALEAAGVG